MKLSIPLLVFFVLALSCKGPGKGPLVNESFEEQEEPNMVTAHQHQKHSVGQRADIKIEPCEGCITIGKLVSEKSSYSGKVVRIRGVVTRINEDIMERNWIHIQDGTETEGVFDLTVTSNEKPSVGETVTFEGRIVLDKDFGFGYFYSIIMEEGKTTK